MHVRGDAAAFQLLGPHQVGEKTAAIGERLLGGAALGHVPGDLAEAAQFAGVVEEGGDHHVVAQNRDPSLRMRRPSSSSRPSAVAAASSRWGLQAAMSSGG